MRPTTEEYFKIIKQPDNFCHYIDLFLGKIKEFKSDADSNVKDLSNQCSEEDQILDLDKIYLESSNLDEMSDLSDEMISWSKGWLNIFENGFDLEKDDSYKKQLSLIFCEASEKIRDFECSFDSFYSEYESSYNALEVCENYYNQYIENYNIATQDKNFVDNEIEEQISDIYDSLLSEFNDIDRAHDKLVDALESLRDAASTLRQYINEKLKIHAKVQMTRINDDDWDTFYRYFLNEKEISHLHSLVEDCEKIGLEII